MTFEEAEKITQEIGDKIERERGAAEERARIVAWVHYASQNSAGSVRLVIGGLLNRIEELEHLK